MNSVQNPTIAARAAQNRGWNGVKQMEIDNSKLWMSSGACAKLGCRKFSQACRCAINSSFGNMPIENLGILLKIFKGLWRTNWVSLKFQTVQPTPSFSIITLNLPVSLELDFLLCTKRNARFRGDSSLTDQLSIWRVLLTNNSCFLHPSCESTLNKYKKLCLDFTLNKFFHCKHIIIVAPHLASTLATLKLR